MTEQEKLRAVLGLKPGQPEREYEAGEIIQVPGYSGGEEDGEEGMTCPNCGESAIFSARSESFTETHGLDCGPYETWTETWLTCFECGAKTDDAEISAMGEEVNG